MTGDYTLQTDDRAVLEAERLAGLVRQPGLRAHLTDSAALTSRVARALEACEGDDPALLAVIDILSGRAA